MIFKNALDNAQEIIDYAENSNAWLDWYIFGKTMDIYKSWESFDSFPTKEEWDRRILKNPITKDVKKVADYFYEATKIYFDKYGLDDKQINFQNINLARYDQDSSIYEDYAMNHHTDWQQDRKDIPENSFYVTCLFYLNDNYDNGQIIFRKLNDDQNEIEYTFEYKPSAGDILIFPSTPPYYHGVKTTTNGRKYFLRTYWRKWQEASSRWNNGVEEHGLEEWQKIQDEYSKELRKNNFAIVENDKKIYFQGMQNIMKDLL